MRFFAIVLAGLILAGCMAPTADPYLKVRSPFWGGADPVLVPAGYMQPVQTSVQYVPIQAVPVQAAPQAAPCFPVPATPAPYTAPCAP